VAISEASTDAVIRASRSSRRISDNCENPSQTPFVLRVPLKIVLAFPTGLLLDGSVDTWRWCYSPHRSADRLLLFAFCF
jgi:hypothetical protein